MNTQQPYHRIGRGSKLIWWALCSSLLLFSPACVEPMPEGRGAPNARNTVPEQRDFGQAVYDLILREAAIHPTLSKQRVAAVQRLNQKWNIPKTLNALIPPNQLKPVELFMRSLLGFYDDGTISSLTQDGAKVLRDAVQKPSLLAALELAAKRKGMSPPLRLGQGSFLLRVLEFPKHRQLLLQVANWWLAHDGLSEDGKQSFPGQQAVLARLFNTLGTKLEQLLISGKKEEKSLLNDILLLQDKRLDLKIGPRCAARFDNQGNPVLSAVGQALKDSGQTLPPPFPEGTKAAKGPCGEAVDASGKRLYDIRELPQTILGSLLRFGRELLIRDLPLRSGQIPFPFNMPIGIRPLLGPLSSQGTYTTNNPLMQTVQAGMRLLKGPKLYELLQLFARISEKEEAQLAATLGLLDQIYKLSLQYKTDIRAKNTLFEDLLPFVQEIVSTPGMLKDLLTALQTPGLSDKLKRGMLLLLRYKKKKISAEDYANFKKGKIQAIFKDKVDHGLPDREGNVSYFQRLMHLMHDFNRHPYRSKIKALGGISIPFIEMRVSNIALMFLKSITGELKIWDTLYVNGKPIQDGLLKTQLKKSLPSLGLSERPTPEELSAFVNRKLEFKNVPLLGSIKVNLRLDDIHCKEGFSVIKHHGDILLAGLAAGLIANDGGALRPIARVFSKYKKLDRLLDIFALVHKHWGSSGSDERTSERKKTYLDPPTNMRSAEPLVMEVLEQTQLFSQLEKFGKILLETRLSDAPNAPLGLPSVQRYLAFAIGVPGTPLRQTTLQPLLDALDAITQALDGTRKQRARNAWQGALDALFDLLLQVEGKGAKARFKNRRAPIVLTRLLYFMADDVKKRATQGQWSPELSRLQTRIEEFLVDPIVPKILDVLDSLVNDQVLLDLTTQVLTHTLPDPTKKPEQFGEFLQLAGSLLSPVPENITVPLGQFMGTFLKRRQPLLTRVMDFLKRSIPLDKEDQFIGLLRRAAVAHQTQNTLRASFFVGLIRAMYRVDPAAVTDPNVEDYRQMFGKTAHYLTDKDKGLEKLYSIIRQRNGPTGR